MTNLSASEITKLTILIDGQPRGRLASTAKTLGRLKSTLTEALGDHTAAAKLLERAMICETYGGAEATLKAALAASRASDTPLDPAQRHQIEQDAITADWEAERRADTGTEPDAAHSAPIGATAVPGWWPAPDTNTETDPAPKARTPREGTKQTALIAMLRAPDGATIEEIIAATGWRANVVRGAMSGALGKKLGLTVTSAKEDDRGRVYRINRALA